MPFAKSSVQATEALMFAITPVEGQEGATKPQAMGKARKKQPFAMQQADHAETEFVKPSDDDSDYDDMPPLIPADNWEPLLGAADQSGVPCKARCQLSGALMTDPVMSPDGYLFDRAALEDWITTYPSNPLSGTPLQMADCADAVEL